MHNKLCGQDNCQHFSMPSKDKSILRFTNFSSLVPYPFVIYADLETVILPKRHINNGKLVSKKVHRAAAVCAYTVCNVNDEYSSAKPFLYVGYDCIDKLLEHLNGELFRVNNILCSCIKPLVMNEQQKIDFQMAKKCYMCFERFTDASNKVRDHCHLSGNYRFPLCSRCNLTYAKASSNIVVLFHGLNNYDHHFIVSKLGKYKNMYNINVLPKNSQKFLSFTLGRLTFKDSIEFLNASLSSLVKNLLNKGEEYFKHVNKIFVDPNKRKLLYRKGVFPYNYLSNIQKLSEQQLPEIECFYNDLTGEDISESEYAFANEVWETFACEDLKDYLSIYLVADVLLLADVFENFRANCMLNYNLDPAYYVSTPQYSLNAFLRRSNINLELFSDINKYLFVNKGVRGGVSMSVKRFAKANNRYLKEFDSNEEASSILYLDCNNLYGHAMAQWLPCSDFKWVRKRDYNLQAILNCAVDSSIGYILECTLSYPSKLHYIHNDYPLAPEHKKIYKSSLSPVAKMMIIKNGIRHNSSEKLLCTFYTKHRYVLHYRCLQLYVSLGMKIRKVHKVLSFTQGPILKDYIMFNTQKRAESNNDFDKNYFKLMCNSLFGKTMERQERRTKVNLVTDVEKYERIVSKLTFKSAIKITKDLVSCQSKYPTIKINKPTYLGMCILDIAKYFMYLFHYKVMLPFYGKNRLRLLYTDTDSLVYHVQTEDLYSDLNSLKEYFDFSNYDPSHSLFSSRNKKIPGYFKDECGGKSIKCFVSLRSKMYAFILDDNNEEKKIAKGVHKSVIHHKLKFKNYFKSLFNWKQYENDFSCIRSKSHEVYTSEERKMSLSPFDDKRYLVSHLESIPYGHRDIAEGNL